MALKKMLKIQPEVNFVPTPNKVMMYNLIFFTFFLLNLLLLFLEWTRILFK